MAAGQAAENHRGEWGLTWCLWWGRYTSIPIWTHSLNSLATAHALSLNICSHGTSLKWSQGSSHQHENSHKLCNETSLTNSQWKLRQHDQNLPMKGEPL